MRRFAKSDWLDLGLDVLVSDGSAGVRIDRLCERAGRTKGSFYHHFNDRDAYVTDLMAYWEERLTRAVTAQTEQISDPVKRLRSVNKLTIGADADLEQELRRWAGSDAIVEAGVARVDKRRVDYLARLWQDAKDIPSQQAIDLAVMDVAMRTGLQQLYAPLTDDRRTRIDQYYAQLKKNLSM